MVPSLIMNKETKDSKEKPIEVHATALKATIGGTQYEWVGGCGAILRSREKHVRVGDVRIIGNELFYAYMVTRDSWFQAPEIGWSVPDKEKRYEPDWIRKFKAAIFT